MKEKNKNIGGNIASNKEIIALANTLSERIRSSNEYRNYCEARQNLHGDKKNSQLLSEYRKQQLRLHIAQISGEDTEEDFEDLEQAYFTFCSDEVISNFLYAEGRFSRLLGDVQAALGKNLDIWMELGIDENDSGQFLN